MMLGCELIEKDRGCWNVGLVQSFFDPMEDLKSLEFLCLLEDLMMILYGTMKRMVFSLFVLLTTPSFMTKFAKNSAFQ